MKILCIATSSLTTAFLKNFFNGNRNTHAAQTIKGWYSNRGEVYVLALGGWGLQFVRFRNDLELSLYLLENLTSWTKWTFIRISWNYSLITINKHIELAANIHVQVRISEWGSPCTRHHLTPTTNPLKEASTRAALWMRGIISHFLDLGWQEWGSELSIQSFCYWLLHSQY